MKSNHTQSKWSVLKSDMINGFNIFAEGKKDMPILIASVHTEDLQTDEEAEANANLIASAPDMLEALKQTEITLKYLLTFNTSIRDIIEEQLISIQSCIRKAEGNI